MPEKASKAGLQAEPPSNEQIAQQLERIAELLEGQDANPFRIQAYRRAAETLRGLDEPAHADPGARGDRGAGAAAQHRRTAGAIDRAVCRRRRDRAAGAPAGGGQLPAGAGHRARHRSQVCRADLRRAGRRNAGGAGGCSLRRPARASGRVRAASGCRVCARHWPDGWGAGGRDGTAARQRLSPRSRCCSTWIASTGRKRNKTGCRVLRRGGLIPAARHGCRC